MIIDILKFDYRYSHSKPLRQAFDFIKKTDFSTLSEGKIEIDEDMCGILLKPGTSYKTVSKLEVHKKFLDLHYVITGCEVFGWKSADDCYGAEGEFNELEDYQLFADQNFNRLTLPAGHFVVVYPEDAHVPCVTTNELTKIVLKVKI